MSKESKKLSLMALILMIFTSVYGFNNMPRSFYLMGYGAIPFYVISAIIFFVPFAFMIAEYGSAFKDEKGGIFSWMEKSVNTKYAFVATFMWYTSYVIWLVNISSGIMVPVSNAIFGTDTTAEWSLLGLNGPQTLGILGVAFILVVTFFSSNYYRRYCLHGSECSAARRRADRLDRQWRQALTTGAGHVGNSGFSEP